MKKCFSIAIVVLLLGSCTKDTGLPIISCRVYGHVKDKVTGLPVDTFHIQICKVVPMTALVLGTTSTDTNGNYSVILPFNNNLTPADKISIAYYGPTLGLITGGNGIVSQVKESIEYNMEFLCISTYYYWFKSVSSVADSISFNITNSYYPTSNTTLLPASNHLALGLMFMPAHTKSYLHYSVYRSGIQTNYTDSIIPACGTTTIDTLHYN